jgi:L-aspartate oxidase
MAAPPPDRVDAGEEVLVDVVVVGSGIAGLVATLDLLALRPGLRVALVDKGRTEASGSTPLAQGGLAAAVGADDSPALHAADTVRAGDGHCDLRAVAVLAAETPDRVADLQRWGAVFDVDADGALSLAREGASAVSRSVRAADATGAEIHRALRRAALDVALGDGARGRILRLQGTARSLALAATPEAPVTGVWILLDPLPQGGAATPVQGGGLALLRARAVLLATGGCGGLYAGTTNDDGATADAVALAGRAGADLVDLEFVQFHPTGLRAADPRTWQRFLLTEALRGAGAQLLDVDGRRFMPARHPDAELAPRHVVAKAILDQPGGAWLDCRTIPRSQLEQEFPTVLEGARRFGFDLTAEPVPVEPCEHYMIGGVRTDLHGRTSAPGLYAAGECASSGVHGANRMAGNSLAQSCVFAHRVALDLAASLPEGHDAGDPAPPPASSADPAALDVDAVRDEVRRAMSAGAGAIRHGDGLRTARARLDDVRRIAEAAWGGPVPPLHRDHLELASALEAAVAVVDAAVRRPETRGSHFRDDHPDHDPAWAGRRQVVRPAPAW